MRQAPGFNSKSRQDKSLTDPPKLASWYGKESCVPLKRHAQLKILCETCASNFSMGKRGRRERETEQERDFQQVVKMFLVCLFVCLFFLEYESKLPSFLLGNKQPQWSTFQTEAICIIDLGVCMPCALLHYWMVWLQGEQRSVARGGTVEAETCQAAADCQQGRWPEALAGFVVDWHPTSSEYLIILSSLAPFCFLAVASPLEFSWPQWKWDLLIITFDDLLSFLPVLMTLISFQGHTDVR